MLRDMKNKLERCNDDSGEKEENKPPLVRIEKNRVHFYMMRFLKLLF